MENVTHAIHLDKYQVKKDGTSALYMRLTINRKVKLIPLHKYIKAEHFDFTKRRVKELRELPNAKSLNTLLTRKSLLMDEILLDLQNRKKPLSFNNIKNLYQSGGNRDFIGYCLREVEHEYEAGEIKYYTLKSIKNRLNKVARYQKGLNIYEIDDSWLAKYKMHLVSKYKNSVNTIASDFCVIRKYLRRAKKQGIIKYNPFENDVKVVWEEGGKPHLDIDELRTALEYYKSEKFLKMKKVTNNQVFDIGKKYQDTLQHFLIGCFTGLRFSDIKTLRSEHIHLIEGVIRKKMCKGKLNKEKTVTIPLTQQIRDVLDLKRLDGKLYGSNVRHTGDINKYLREALDKIKICKNKHITFHSSRHTFCVTALTLGMPVETVQNVMGHRDIKTTLIYAKIVDSKRKKDMSVWDKFEEQTDKKELHEVA